MKHETICTITSHKKKKAKQKSQKPMLNSDNGGQGGGKQRAARGGLCPLIQRLIGCVHAGRAVDAASGFKWLLRVLRSHLKCFGRTDCPSDSNSNSTEMQSHRIPRSRPKTKSRVAEIQSDHWPFLGCSSMYPVRYV